MYDLIRCYTNTMWLHCACFSLRAQVCPETSSSPAWTGWLPTSSRWVRSAERHRRILPEWKKRDTTSRHTQTTWPCWWEFFLLISSRRIRNQFILESKWTFVNKKFNKLPKGVLEVSCSPETDTQPENMSPATVLYCCPNILMPTIHWNHLFVPSTFFF